MEETGKDIGEINLKTITLAKEEAKNEESIAKIDQVWKQTTFDMMAYKKGNEIKTYIIFGVEEIRQLLEDNILTL